VIQGWFEHKGQRMTDDDLETEMKADGKLDDAMKDFIRLRHGHGRKYIYRHTAAGLVDGSIKPPAPSSSSSSSSSKKISRREASGLTNLPHFDSRMMPLFERAVHTPLPSSSSRSLRDHLESPNRQFNVYTPTHTQPPKLVKGHGNTVMGHGPEDAVDYFNREGHKHTKSDNKAHNSSASVYHGLEDKHASASSGGSTVSRYMSPSPTHGSHPSYYLRDHPQFNPRNPWHSYANQQDAQNRKRYVSPPPIKSSSSSSSSTSSLPPPVSSLPTSSSLSQPTTLSSMPSSQTTLPPPTLPFGQPSQPPLFPSISSLSQPTTLSSTPSSQTTFPPPMLPFGQPSQPPLFPSISSRSAPRQLTPPSSSSSSQEPSLKPPPMLTSEIMPQVPFLARPIPRRPPLPQQQAPPRREVKRRWEDPPQQQQQQQQQQPEDAEAADTDGQQKKKRRIDQ
jgi:hypothetical protein